MAERSSSLACKKFSANVFDKNKCQNCFKPKDTHSDVSSTQPNRPTSLEVCGKASKITVKSGGLFIASQVSTLPKVQVQKWEKVWLLLYSSGTLEWFADESTKSLLGSMSLDDCVGLTSAEVDTNEPFSIGIKTSSKTHYLKAENRLEMDNWCRVLKPFVIASPGYKFNKSSPTTRAHSYYDSKNTSSLTNIVQERKTSLSRTVSAPWHLSTDAKSASLPRANDVTKKRWSATEELIIKKDVPDKDTRSVVRNTGSEQITKSTEKQVETDSTLQPYYTDIYLAPESSEQKQNGETSSTISTLQTELVEAKRVAKLNQGKAEMCSRNLSDLKKQLEKANNVISIQKVNIDALTSEVETLKTRLKCSDEVVDKRLKELESQYPACNGSTSRDSIETGFIKLQSKLQENEKALIRRTRELEKANESRKKVAKHTRALLLELEEKLTSNNRRINELEEQLMNRTLDLQYEKEERLRIEREKGLLVRDMNASNSHSKQREITKRSTELLQQAKEDHRLSKNEQKTYQEIEGLHKQLKEKTTEIQKLQKHSAALHKKDDEMRKLEATCKISNEQLDALRKELGIVNESFSKEKAKCSQLENTVRDISAKVQEKEKQTKKVHQENLELKSEIERTRKECETRVLLLQEDNETTRMRLREIQEELTAVHTETDGRKPNEFHELTREFEKLKTKSHKSEIELKKLQDSQQETIGNFNNEKNKRIKLEKDFEEKAAELRNSQDELEKLRELLRTAQETIRNESKRVNELENICKSTKDAGEQVEAKNSLELGKLQERIQNYQNEIEDIKEKHGEKTQEVLDLNAELRKRIKIEEEMLSKIKTVELSLNDAEFNVFSSMDDSKRDKKNVLDAADCLREKVELLKCFLKDEKSKVESSEQSLKENEASKSRCSVCEKRKNDNSTLVQELDEVKEAHRKEVEKLQESLKSEAQTMKSNAEEVKLKLTSKVILLQSDISELNAKHELELIQANDRHQNEAESWRQKLEQELNQANEASQKKQRELEELNERLKQDIEFWRAKCDSFSTSNNVEIVKLREKVGNLETQLSSERESNEQKIEALRKEYEAKAPENGFVSLEEFQEVKKLHRKELEDVKESHRKELEENKSDMMMVLQALKSDSYQSSSRSNESLEMNDEMKKLERYVETLKKDHAKEIDKLNKKHEEDVEQLRSDMVTLLRVQETYKTSDEEKANSNGNIVDLSGQLAALKRSHEKEMREKDAQHQNEVDQLKCDMLVAIQAASTVGKIGAQASTSLGGGNERVAELEQQIAKMERDFEEERENFQNAIKKAESATKFGLRRNEEMSNKIYQMQREMEEIDNKYQKEIKLYKEAFDQEKNRKTTIGAVPGILAENDSLKVKVQEYELLMEQAQVRYDNEMKRYKEKFQQENVLTVEELQLKIKSLEDSIEQMRLEHETEVEKYTKAVKRGKVSLSSTVKERDLERKIDDLESNIGVMRQKHREEVRKYRERLEDEMERHRKEVSESRAKLRKLEADTRQMEDLKSKIADLESKIGKLTKEASKYKEHELELNETKSKNRELQRQVDALKRKLEKLDEAAEENKGTSTESQLSSARAKLSRYSSCDSIGLSSTGRTKTQQPEGEEGGSNEEDVFEMNNDAGKSEIGGYKLNPGLKRPASVSAFPVLTDSGSRRTINDKKRESGSTTNRPSYQPSYTKGSNSVSSLK